MASNYENLVSTASVRAAQQHYYGAAAPLEHAIGPDDLGELELEFIGARDSFYMATVGASGWPYIQHRGGEPGFLHALDARTLAFADFGGNRQLLSTGNLAHDERVALFLIDYVQRRRLKLLGRARVLDAREHAELAQRLAPARGRARVERIFVIDVVAFDWNCPQHIVPRFTREQVSEVVEPLRLRITELEALLAKRSSQPKP